MKKLLTLPLELKKKNVNLWNDSDYKCIAIISDDKKEIKNAILNYSSELLKRFGKAFVIIWVFDEMASQSFYVKVLRSLTMLSKSDAYLIYTINNLYEVNKILQFWGEFDILDIIFPKMENDFEDELTKGFYKNYRRYEKDLKEASSVSVGNIMLSPADSNPPLNSVT